MTGYSPSPSAQPLDAFIRQQFDVLQTVRENMPAILKVASHLTPVEDLEDFRDQVEELYPNLGLLVEASSLLLTASEAGLALLLAIDAPSQRAALALGSAALRSETDFADASEFATAQLALASLTTTVNGLILALANKADKADFDALRAEFDAMGDAGGLVARVTALEALIADGTYLEDLNNQVTTLLVRMNDYEANVITQGGVLDSLIAQVVDAEGQLVALTTAQNILTNEVDIHGDSIETNSAAITELQAHVVTEDERYDLQAAATTALTTRVTANEDLAELTSAQVTLLTGRVTDTETGLDGQVLAMDALTARVTSTEDGIEIQSGSITSLEARLGAGGNMVPNAGFETGLSGWEMYSIGVDWATPVMDRVLVTTGDIPALRVRNNDPGITPTNETGVRSGLMQVEDAKFYILSGYQAAEDCTARIDYQVLDAAMAVVTSGVVDNTTDPVPSTLSAWDRVFNKFFVPAGGLYVRVRLWARLPTGDIPTAWFSRLMLEEVVATQSEPSPWIVGAAGLDTALATARTSLEALITTQGGLITAQAAQITALEASVAVLPHVYLQATAPSGGTYLVGDMWLDSDDGNKVYIWDGAIWSESLDVVGATIYAQTAAPSGGMLHVGDIWFDTDDGNKQHRWNGTTWVAMDDTRIAATASAVTALSTTVTTHNGQLVSLMAQYVLTLDVNGYVSGWRFMNDGSTSDFEIAADKVKITSPAGYKSVELSDGILASISATHARYMGLEFGALSEFIDWYGPKPGTGPVGATDAAGIYYVKKSGAAYFGGLLNPTEVVTHIGGTGTNLIWDEYSRFMGPALPPTTVSGAFVRSFDAADRAVGSTDEGSLKIVANGSGTAATDRLWLGNSATDYNIPIAPGKRYIISVRVKVGTAGHQVKLAVKASDGTVYPSSALTIASTGIWSVQSFIADLTANTSTAMIVALDPNFSNVASRQVWFDGIMVEAMVGDATAPSTWSAGQAGRNALVAISNAATAQATADGKIDSYRQASPPTIGVGFAGEGDIWFDSDDDNKIYTVVAGAWLATPDSRIAAALIAAGAAQTTANGKNTIWYAASTATPTATATGDLWFQTDTYLIKRWNGTSWLDNGATLVAGQVQNGVILPYSFGDELVANGSFESNVSGTRVTSVNEYAVGINICDGWQVRYNGNVGLATGLSTAQVDTGNYTLFIGIATARSIPAVTELRTDIKMIQLIPVKADERFLLSGYISWLASIAVPAGLTAAAEIYCIFYNSAGGAIVSETLAGAYGTTKRLSKAITAPTGAVNAEIFCLAKLYNTTGGAISSGNYPIQAFFDSVSLKRLSFTGSNPNLLVNSDFANGNVGWNGSPTIFKAGEEGYQGRSGALTSGSYVYYYQDISLAPAAGESFTFAADAYMVGTLDSNSLIDVYIEYLDSGGTYISATPAVGVTAATQTGNYARLVTSGPCPASTGKVRAVVRMRGAFTGGLGIFRRAKLERGPIDTAYTVGVEGVFGQELVVPGSGRRLGDARNARNAQAGGVGAIANNGVISAASTGVVSIAAFTMSYGGAVTISYSAVTSAVSGLTQNVTYYIYCIDDDYAGGVRTWFATTSLATAMNAGLGVVVVGQITIPTSGSTSADDPSDPACPLASLVSPEGVTMGSLKPGDWTMCWDLCVDNPGMVLKQVRNNRVVETHCAVLHAENGIEVPQSLTTPMRLPDGTYRKTTGMYGQEMLTYNEGIWEWSRVTDIRDIGMQMVAELDLDDSILLAGVTAEQQVATHNTRWKG